MARWQAIKRRWRKWRDLLVEKLRGSLTVCSVLGNEMHKRRKFAGVVQAGWRGRQSRLVARRQRAARQIQSVYRGHVGRRFVWLTVHAKLCQKWVRRYLTRQRFRAMKAGARMLSLHWRRVLLCRQLRAGVRAAMGRSRPRRGGHLRAGHGRAGDVHRGPALFTGRNRSNRGPVDLRQWLYGWISEQLLGRLRLRRAGMLQLHGLRQRHVEAACIARAHRLQPRLDVRRHGRGQLNQLERSAQLPRGGWVRGGRRD